MGNEVSASGYGLVGMRYRMTHDRAGHVQKTKVDASTNLTPTREDYDRGEKLLAGRDPEGTLAAFTRSEDWLDGVRSAQNADRDLKAFERKSKQSYAALGRQVAKGGPKPAAPKETPNLRPAGTLKLPAPVGEPIARALSQNDPNKLGGQSAGFTHRKVVTR